MKKETQRGKKSNDVQKEIKEGNKTKEEITRKQSKMDGKKKPNKEK
jgi:hypothetical protein